MYTGDFHLPHLCTPTGVRAICVKRGIAFFSHWATSYAFGIHPAFDIQVLSESTGLCRDRGSGNPPGAKGRHVLIYTHLAMICTGSKAHPVITSVLGTPILRWSVCDPRIWIAIHGLPSTSLGDISLSSSFQARRLLARNGNPSSSIPRSHAPPGYLMSTSLNHCPPFHD